jgi:hypothetical protein
MVPLRAIFYPLTVFAKGTLYLRIFFLLCAEGLSSLIQKAKTYTKISRLPFSRNGHILSHLFFADDSLLFCRSTFSEWCTIHDLLEAYEKVSGQMINRDKTSIFFSKNTRREFKEHILTSIGASSSQSYAKYLGLLALVIRDRKKAFASISGKSLGKAKWMEGNISLVS